MRGVEPALLRKSPRRGAAPRSSPPTLLRQHRPPPGNWPTTPPKPSVAGIDVLVNNAGVYPAAPTAQTNDDTFDRVIAVNVRAPFYLVAQLAPSMAQRGRGTIINIGSWVSTVGLPVGVLYAASKAMLEQLTRGWAAELGPAGVRVNAIAPGIIATEGNADHTKTLDPMVNRFPARRLGLPDEIAHAAVYLASDEATFMHGSTLLIDGGALTTRA